MATGTTKRFLVTIRDRDLPGAGVAALECDGYFVGGHVAMAAGHEGWHLLIAELKSSEIARGVAQLLAQASSNPLHMAFLVAELMAALGNLPEQLWLQSNAGSDQPPEWVKQP